MAIVMQHVFLTTDIDDSLSKAIRIRALCGFEKAITGNIDAQRPVCQKCKRIMGKRYPDEALLTYTPPTYARYVWVNPNHKTTNFPLAG